MAGYNDTFAAGFSGDEGSVAAEVVPSSEDEALHEQLLDQGLVNAFADFDVEEQLVPLPPPPDSPPESESPLLRLKPGTNFIDVARLEPLVPHRETPKTSRQKAKVPADAKESKSSRAAPLADKDKRAPTGRKLSRRPSEPQKPIVAMTMCVRGGPLSAPVPVHPLQKAGGKEWIHACAHLQWLRKACSSSGFSHYDLRFQSAINDMSDCFRSALAASESTTNQGVIRDHLGLSDDEMPPSSSAARSSTKKGKKPKPTAGALKTDTIPVQLGDTQVQMQRSWRPMLVVATIEHAQAMVGFCLDRVSSDGQNLRRKRSLAGDGGGESKRFAMTVDSCPRITGKISWHPSHQGWCVAYKDPIVGNTRSWFQVKDFAVKEAQSLASLVANKSASSSSASPAEIDQAARKRAYDYAVAFWNANDRSTKDRIVV